MVLQTIVVALLVVSCAAYAAWTLMPAGARRAIAVRLLRLQGLPAPWKATLRRHADAASGCGCDGCDRSPLKAPAAASKAASSATPSVQPIRFHPRPPR